MKVIVTGAAGHFGSMLVGHLLYQGIEVVAVDRLMHQGESLLGFLSHPKFRFENIDLRQRFLADDEEAEFVVHLAALVGPVCEVDSEESWRTNHEVVGRVKDWVKSRKDTRMIFSSTCSNYGITEGMATESTPLTPTSVYAETKVAAEDVIADLGDRGIVLRFGTLAGLSPRPRFDTLLNQWAYEGWSTGTIECQQPEAWRPFIHVTDAVEAVIGLITDWPNNIPSCYNVVGFNTTKIDLAKEVQRQTGCELKLVEAAVDRRDYAVSDESFRNAMGIQPKFNMADCVGEVYGALKLGILEPRSNHYNA